MNKDLILSLDLGTQSARALLFDAKGKEQGKCQLKLPPYQTPQPGWMETDPEIFWKSMASCCRGVLTETSTRERVAAVVVTAQRGTLIAVDEQGHPLMPAISWQDLRRCEAFPDLGWWGTVFGLMGLRKTLTHFQKEAEINWVAQYRKDLHVQVAKWLTVSGFLHFKLLGRFVDASSAQVGYLPFDYRRQTWAKPWDWKFKALALQPHQLPELSPPGTLLGTISTQASKETEIPAGLPVLAAAADKACESLGSGVLADSVAGLSFGTTVTANALSSRYREPLPLLPAYPAAVPHHYLLEVQQSRGFSLVSWFLQEFGHPEREQAQREGRSSERLLDDLLAQTPPLAHGLVTLPTFSPGVIYPGPEARGAMVGFGDVHGRAHLYRSLMEGLAFAMRFGVEQLERRLGRSFSALHVSGGGSRSPAVVQLVCDVLGRPCRQLATYEASALGAAINGAVGLNWYGSYREAVDQMVKMGETFVPDANNLVEYQQMYRQVYRKLYGQLRKNFQVMKQITGYPH